MLSCLISIPSSANLKLIIDFLGDRACEERPDVEDSDSDPAPVEFGRLALPSPGRGVRSTSDCKLLAIGRARFRVGVTSMSRLERDGGGLDKCVCSSSTSSLGPRLRFVARFDSVNVDAAMGGRLSSHSVTLCCSSIAMVGSWSARRVHDLWSW